MCLPTGIWREYVRDGESRVHSATSAKHISGKQCVVVMRAIAHCNKATHVSGSNISQHQPNMFLVSSDESNTSNGIVQPKQHIFLAPVRH